MHEVVGSPARAVIVIPARLESRRFARKVLARETGKFLIQHVWEEVLGTPRVERVIVATDSDEVAAAARSFGAETRLTSAEHLSGTDRVAEVVRELDEDIVINVQGDEPSVCRDDLARLVEALERPPSADVVMATLARWRRDRAGYLDPNVVKVITDKQGRALYFSRSPVPGWHRAEAPRTTGAEVPSWLHHIGIYAYRREFLATFTSLPPGELEKRERLEQLRALENGYRIQSLETDHDYAGIDTEEEYQAFVARYRATTS